MQQHFIYIDNIDPYRSHVVTLNQQGEVTNNSDSVVLSSLKNIHPHDDDSTKGSQVYLILSDHFVSAYELDIKAKNRQQLEKAARFAIEDMLPLEVDEYHIVTQKNEKGGASIRCIPTIRLEQLLKNCEKIGLNVKGITIETDLLDRQRSTLLIKKEDSSLSTPSNKEVLDFDNSILPILSERLFSILENEKELDVIFSPESQILAETLAAQAPESIRLRQVHRDLDYFEQLAIRYKSKQAINLLQGDFTSSSIESSEKNNWLFPALLALASGFLFTGGLVAQNIYLNKQVNNQEQQLIQAYVERYPNSRKPRDVVEVSSRLKSKARGTNQSNSTVVDHLSLLESIAISKKQYQVELVGFTFEANQCDLVVNAKNVEDINQYKSALESSLKKLNAQSIEQTSVNAKDDKYQGKFKIKF